MGQDPKFFDAGVAGVSDELFETFVVIDEDAAAGELIACLDRMAIEVGHHPELLDDLRWEIAMMKLRTGRNFMH